MNVLKDVTVGILCFLLFLALTVFGIAYTVNSTALNPDFVTGEINDLEVSTLVKEYVDFEPPPEMPELKEVVFDTVESLEPVIKERLDDTIHAIYEYIPENTRELELNRVLRDNFLTDELVESILDNIDIAQLTGLLITQQFADQIPIEIENFDEYVTDAIEAAEPAIRAQLVSASGPVFDYILGIRQTLNVSISLSEVTDSLKGSIRQSLIDSPPPELASVPVELRTALFDTFYDEIADMLPASFIIDESVISPEVPSEVSNILGSAEDGINEGSTYIGYFKTAYSLLIVFMAVLVLLIIVILRDVRKITRRLGVPLITYGALEYIAIWVGRLISNGSIQLPEMMPEYLQDWVFQFANNLLRPLEIFSLALLVAGVILVTVSFIYKRGSEESSPVP